MAPEFKKAYEKLSRATRDILKLAEPNGDGFEIHQDCYNDLAEAHKAVYQQKLKVQGQPSTTKAEHNRRMVQGF